MITSSITAQCYPLRIIHNAIYTLNEIYLPLCIVRIVCGIFLKFLSYLAIFELSSDIGRCLATSIVGLILLSDVGVPFVGIVDGSSIQYHGWFVLAKRNLGRWQELIT